MEAKLFSLAVISSCVLFGILGLIGSLEAGLGNFSTPGAGLWPAFISFVLLMLVVSLLMRDGMGLKQVTDPELGGELRYPIILGLLMIGYLVFYEWLGFVLTTTALITLSSSLIGQQGIKSAALLGAVSSVALYFLFSSLLSVRLASGLLGL